MHHTFLIFCDRKIIRADAFPCTACCSLLVIGLVSLFSFLHRCLCLCSIRDIYFSAPRVDFSQKGRILSTRLYHMCYNGSEEDYITVSYVHWIQCAADVLVLLAYLPTWNGEYVSIMAVMVIMDEHVPPINTVSSGHEEVLFFMDILSASTPS